MKLSTQLRTHSIAIISLLTAVLGLSYNTLQTDRIEQNATRRDAAFETLLALGALQEVVHFAHFVESRSGGGSSSEEERGNPITGWSQVLLVKDLAFIVKPIDEAAMSNLFEVWQQNFNFLDDPASEKKISDAIVRSREACVAVLAAL